MSKRRKPFTFKDNYWSRKRVEKGYTVKTIAKKTGINNKTLTSYFTGLSLPKPYAIASICDLFGVDYEEGRVQFERAHRAYEESHRKGRRLVCSARVRYQPKKKYKKHKDSANAVSVSTSDILPILYGKIPYADYIALVTESKVTSEILSSLYGKVDFETYMKLSKI